jgi:hypothetical protein
MYLGCPRGKNVKEGDSKQCPIKGEETPNVKEVGEYIYETLIALGSTSLFAVTWCLRPGGDPVNCSLSETLFSNTAKTHHSTLEIEAGIEATAVAEPGIVAYM